ncbi:SGNH/GDSL hydrolase family protein [uncultured Jatrophihabitans sp.]|uniref:SGNH/GDSL hydrolase family protein n=1 Tax=uncultured Jatrophihabitans sp. TaxID=1610747 RepID=UPI0035CB928E
MSTRALHRVWCRVVVVAVACAIACVGFASVGVARTQAAESRAHVAGSAPRHHRCGPWRRPRLGTTRHMLVIGASYTAGVGASGPHHGYAWLLARQLHESPRVYGIGGTGFVNAGPRHQGTFRHRLAHLRVRPAPDLVLIQGGRNDVGTPARIERAAARATICLAQRRFTKARVAVLGPIPARLPVDRAVAAIDGDLRSACRAEHALYLDPIRRKWMTPTLERRFAGPVPRHPNDAGYRYIASRAAPVLRAGLARART